jgi:hypothetical protein
VKILILSYIYWPDASPRAYRWTAIAERWAASGHQVDIVAGRKRGDAARENRNGVTIHRTAGIIDRLRGLLGRSSHRATGGAASPTSERESLLRRLYGLTLKQIQWPDYAFDWRLPAQALARTLLREHHYAALISVSHPFTPHLVGHAVKCDTPDSRWLVDIGDPFSLLDEIPLNNPALYRRLNRRAEARILRDADAIAVTVARCAAEYRAAFAIPERKIAVIPSLLSLPAEPPGGPMSFGPGRHLVFIGTLYRALRDPAPLLALFAALRARRDDLHLHFFGALHDCEPCFAPHADAIGRSIHLRGTVPRETVAAAMAGADILVNIGNATAHQLPSKLVEYVAAARPILNLAAATADTASDFLATYPAALTLRLGAAPSPTDCAAALAFIAAPPAIDRAALDRFLAPHRIETIAAAYEALLALVPARHEAAQ